MSAELHILPCVRRERHDELATPAPVTAPEPHPDLLELLDSVIAQVRSGEIVGVAVALVGPDGATKQAWEAPDCRNSLVAAAAQLLTRMTLPRER